MKTRQRDLRELAIDLRRAGVEDADDLEHIGGDAAVAGLAQHTHVFTDADMQIAR